METIDLRSDTVTLPTPEMREAMYRAEIGDDGYKEDATVHYLQQLAADRVGKEAALFFPSGCMANLVAILNYCSRQGEVILGSSTDMYLWEAGAMSAVGGITPFPLPTQTDGTLDIIDVEKSIRKNDVHFPRTQLISLENTNMLKSGVPLSPDYLRSIHELAKDYCLPLYLDGARVFNAAVALGIDVKDITEQVDALMFCLSKGLCCPAGSILCGSKQFIEKAYRNRKLLGGQMRQVGILAAAGIVALNKMVDRLEEDHHNARQFAQGIKDNKNIILERDDIQTNIVYFKAINSISAEELAEKLLEKGLKVLPMGPWLRAVTHYGIDGTNIKDAIEIVMHVIKEY